MKAVISIPGGKLVTLTSCNAWINNKYEQVPSDSCLGRQHTGHKTVLCPACNTYYSLMLNRFMSRPNYK